MHKKLIFYILFLVFPFVSLSQKKVEIKATGQYEARDLTLEEVKSRAIEDAKKNAMVKAGIAENVTVTDFLYTFEDNDKFQDIFQSFVSTETGAEIVIEKVTEINRDINEFGNILIEVEVDAVIYKHKNKPDRSFVIKVDGIREFYYENDPLNFSFLPTQQGFLRIFNVTDKLAFVLYPYEDTENSMLNDEKGVVFEKNIKVNFPVNNNMDGYYFGIDDPVKDKEYNLLIFVYTKNEIPFLDEPNVANIMRWIYEIPMDERAVEQFGVVVRK
ncbi:MAG: hypothetical protein K9G76_01780 [Bacteroidales bacterium]|nr:hypothetical protein [Bacteroidales bacterium]MCF8403284.1 hypothetical protein [Bacteroidales bacterium]